MSGDDGGPLPTGPFAPASGAPRTPSMRAANREVRVSTTEFLEYLEQHPATKSLAEALALVVVFRSTANFAPVAVRTPEAVRVLVMHSA